MKNIINFINFIQADCKQHGIEVILSPTPYVDDCRGYFSHREKHLVVGMDNPFFIWLTTLLHEYGHFEQWRDKSSLYCSAKVDVSDWISNIRKHEKTIDKLRDCELDCERRCLKLLERFRLPLDKKKYIKQAAAYIHFYNYLKINPKWYTIPPYEIQSILDVMPTTLKGQFKNLNKLQLEEYERNYSDE